MLTKEVEDRITKNVIKNFKDYDRFMLEDIIKFTFEELKKLEAMK